VVPTYQAQAWFVGTRIDVRELERGAVVALTPLTVQAGERGSAVLFRYGVVVFLNLSPVEEVAFLKSLAPLISEPFDNPETERVSIAIASDEGERVDAQGVLRLRELSLERLHVVAHILAKSVVLAHYEERIAGAFDQIERLADRLEHGGSTASSSDLMEQIGNALRMQTQTVGRVEVTEKPEITWDLPDLDRLYERLSLEYELRDRDLALTRKLDLISQTARTYLDLLQTRQSLRLELYIVFLIIVEIGLSVYTLLRG
jgi:uncharacterized Rmd1/YagE family protein